MATTCLTILGRIEQVPLLESMQQLWFNCAAVIALAAGVIGGNVATVV